VCVATKWVGGWGGGGEEAVDSLITRSY
jgi:hypothetical protein